MRVAGPRLPCILIALLASSLCLVTGCGAPADAGGEDEAAGTDHVVAIQPASEKLGDWVTLAGSTQPLPNHAAFISNAVEGRVLEVLPAGTMGKPLSEGDWVEAGQPILRLDDTVAQANLATAQSAVADAAAQVTTAQNGVAEAIRKLERGKSLRRPGDGIGDLASGAMIQDLETALANAQQAEKAAQAKHAGLKSALAAAQKQLSYFQLRAPIAGYLSTVKVSPGQTLAVGTSVAEVVNLKEIDVLCYAPPSMINRLRIGQTAELLRSSTQASSAAPAPAGKVVYIAVKAQADSGSYPVKIRFLNDQMGLRANALVQVRVETQPATDRLVIPGTAIMDDTQPPHVIVAQFEVPRPEEGTPADEAKPASGKEEKAWIAHRYEVVLGVRDPANQMVEVLALHGEDKDDQPPPLKDAWFVTSGWHGVQPNDKLDVEYTRPEQKK